MKAMIGSRLTQVWLFLSAITVVSWWLGHSAHSAHHLVSSTAVTVGVLVIGLVKGRLIVRQFMEVRAAPPWLRRFTDAWLVLFWATVLVVYLS